MSRFTATNFGRMGPSSSPRMGPATIGLIALAVVPFLLAWLGLAQQLLAWFALVPSEALAKVWTLLLYPLANPGDGGQIIGVLFLAYWLYMIGTSLEAEMRSGLLAVVSVILTLIGGLAWWLGGSFLPAGPQIGLFLPSAALTVLWAMRNPESTIMLMMIIPIKAKWLALLAGVVVLFMAGNTAPLMGIFGLLPLLAAFLYATNRIPGLKYGQTVADVKATKKEKKEFSSYMDEVHKREKERDERERLRKLFESSLGDDPDDKR
jgi:hypothetical protein